MADLLVKAAGRGGGRLPGHVRRRPAARPRPRPLDHPGHPRALAGHGAPAAGRLLASHPRHSRDQLGDLAESFNVMADSVQDLLRESGGQGAAGRGAAHRAQDPDEPAAAGNGHPARAARGRALPARGRGGRRLLRPAAALGDAHGRAGGGRLRQGHVGRAVHGGAEGAGALAVADLRVPGAAARGGEPHPRRQHGPAVLHHHDLRGGGHRAAHDDLRPRRPQPAHPR